ncbi:MAG TPA: PqqD family peptide modification chaperone [Stellaceae bacterium]|nr:PqqD family peptide modification chaperone [Stellaceae bacterium]
MAATLSPTSTVQRSEEQIAAAVDDEIIILSVERGSYFGLDDIGSDIWERLANPIRVDALCDALAAEYDANRAVIERDVLALLGKLVDAGLVSAAP